MNLAVRESLDGNREDLYTLLTRINKTWKQGTINWGSFIGFFTLPLLSLRRAALVTLATNAFGALGFIALLVRRRAEEVSSTRASVAEVTATPFVRTSG